MSEFCSNAFRSTACATGLQNVDNKCVCKNYQLTPPYVMHQNASGALSADFNPLAALPITRVGMELVAQRESLVNSDGSIRASAVQVPMPCTTGQKACAGEKACTSQTNYNSAVPAMPFN